MALTQDCPFYNLLALVEFLCLVLLGVEADFRQRRNLMVALLEMPPFNEPLFSDLLINLSNL